MAADHSYRTTIDPPFIVPPCSALTPEDLLILQFLPTRGAWHQIDVMRAIDLTAGPVCDEISFCCHFYVVSIASHKGSFAAGQLEQHQGWNHSLDLAAAMQAKYLSKL